MCQNEFNKILKDRLVDLTDWDEYFDGVVRYANSTVKRFNRDFSE